MNYPKVGSCDLAAFRLSHGQSWDLGAYFDSDKLEVGGDNSDLESLVYTIGVTVASASGDPEYRTPAGIISFPAGEIRKHAT